MEKEIKKLKNRQDVLDVWVSKWAELYWVKIVWAFYKKDKSIWYEWDTVSCVYEYKWERPKLINMWFLKSFRIEQILYSPESNFFVLVFGKVRDWYHKKNCVDSQDPLQYLLDNLNETTS